MSVTHLHDGACACPVIARAEGECRRCVGGIIDLPPEHYHPAEIACPWCRPEEYPNGFPGLAGLIEGSVLIPPMPRS